MKIAPKNGYMLIEYKESLSREFTTAAGLLITKRSPPYLTGLVLDAGEGTLSRDGTLRLPPPAKVGEWVLLRDNAGTARELGFLGPGSRRALVHPDDILAVLDRASFSDTADMPPQEDAGAEFLMPGPAALEVIDG